MKGKILAVLIVMIGVWFRVSDAYALENDSTLKVEYVDKIYSYRYRNGVLRSYGKLPMRYQNNTLVYCIESDRVINANIYNSTNDWSVTGYTEEEKRQMELISYYGYQYKNHNTIKYYMATQELIWSLKDDYIKWVDQFSTDGSKGNIINIDNEKNEILSLVEKHNLLPSFTSQSYSGYFNDELILTDINNVLDDFNIDTNLKYERNGSTIKFYLNKFGDNKVNFSRNIQNKETTVYYYNGDSQMMALFGMNDVSTDMNILVNKVRVKINKKDNDTKKIIKNKAEFNIKNMDTNTYVYEKLKTNNGYISLDLSNGRYVIEEIKAPKGYVINKDNIIIDINDNINLIDNEYVINIYNDKPTGKINIIKLDEDDNILSGVEIGLYDSNHNKISSIITKEKDNYFDNLPLGTYYIKEISTNEGYMLDDMEYKIDLNYINDKTYIVEKTSEIINKKIRCTITYISEDKLKNISINVYDENDKLVFSGITNNEGKLSISNLPYGKYYIKQIKVPKGYILNEEEYTFFVNDSTCNSNISVHNEKTIMPITSTTINKCMCIALILSSIGIFNFVKKSN